MANLSNINNKFLVTTTGEVLVGRTAATGTSKLQVSGSLLIGTDINSGIPLVVQETTAAGFAIGFMRNTNATNGNGLVIDVNSTAGAYIQDWRQASTVKMRLLQNGNLGIGTDSPESKLAVKGTSGDADLFSISDVGVPTSGAEYGVAMIKTASTEFALNITSYSLTGKGVRIYNNGADAARTSFEVLQGAGSRFIVDGIGNVGIGVTPPSTVLLDLKEPDAGSDLIIGLTAGTGARAQIRSEAQSNDTKAELGFYTVTGSSTSEAMRINQYGNVGIGKSQSGNAVLTVKSPAGGNTGIILIEGDTTDDGWGVYATTANKYIITRFTGGSYSDKFTILEGGNVGIGTDAPGAKLDVRGSGGGYLKFDTTGSDGTIKSDYNLKLYADDTGDNSSGFGNMQFFTAGANERMRIQSNGNVGIGVTGPTAKLQIGLNPDPSQTAESLVHLLSSTAPTTANGFNILKLDYLAGNVAGDAGATIIFNQGYHSGNIDYTAPVGALRGYRTGPNYSYGGGLQLLYQPDAGALGLLVGMTLTGNGYVGIGLTAPSARLNTGVNVVGSFLPYLNGTGTSFTTATNIITVHDSSALGTNTTAGLMLINNNNSNDAPSPLIAFSARSTSNTYNHTYAAIWGEKDSTGADTNWNTGSIIFATSTSTGPYERMRINPVGNVTIGTTNNAALLNVGGPILASDNGQTAGMYVTRNLTISHPGSSGTFTRTFNPVTQFGLNRSGAAVKIMASGWQGRLQAGYIVWRNNGGSSNLTAVYYYPSASSGLGETITVGVNAANDNTIDVTFTNWHGNSHGWYTKISVTQ